MKARVAVTDEEKALLQATKSGDAAEVKKLLESGVNPNLRDNVR